MRRRFCLAVGLFSLTASADVWNESEAFAAPILEMGPGNVEIQAELLEIDISNQTAILSGSVSLTKGDLSVKCPKLEVHFDTSPHVRWAKGSGGVVADVRGVHGEAPEVELDLSKQSLELRGGVRLTRGQATLEATRTTIDLSSGKVTAHQVKGSLPVPKNP